MFKTILWVSQSGTGADRAQARAVDLARAHGAQLRVHPSRVGSQGLAQAAADADLVVLTAPPVGVGSLRADPTLRAVLRDCAAPALFVRRPFEGPYRHVLATVDFAPASREVVRRAAALQPRAQLELFHAFGAVTDADGAPRRRSIHPGAVHAQACLAPDRVETILYTDSFDSRRNRVLAALGRGDLARHAANQQEHSGADLLVTCTPRPVGLREFLLGLPVQRVLAGVAADVLVIPTSPPPGAASPAAGGGGGRGLSASMLLPAWQRPGNS